jgi:hypothetical protein
MRGRLSPSAKKSTPCATPTPGGIEAVVQAQLLIVPES